MRRRHVLALVATFLGHGACAARAPRAVPDTARHQAAPAGPTSSVPDREAPAPLTVVDLEPIRIEVVGHDGDEPALDAFDARSLLDDGNAALAEARHDDAIARYEKLLAAFPDSKLAPDALYNIGLACEGKQDYEAALRQYRTLITSAASSRAALEAHLRMAGVLAEQERWGEARQILQDALARRDLTHGDRVEAMARLGYALLELQDHATAEATLRNAVDYFQKLTARLESNYYVAMAYYYLAQIPHRQFQAIPIRLPDEQLARDLDAKARLVTLAYDRYVEALQIPDVYWATASGYQLSQIHKELWDDVVLAPIPTQLDPEASKYYVREVHDRVRTFLDRAMSGHSKNIELAEAYKTSTVWSEASRVRAAEIADILARESAGELVKPDRRAGELTAAAQGEYIPARVDL